jgi:hypothetical protein
VSTGDLSLSLDKGVTQLCLILITGVSWSLLIHVLPLNTLAQMTGISDYVRDRKGNSEEEGASTELGEQVTRELCCRTMCRKRLCCMSS